MVGVPGRLGRAISSTGSRVIGWFQPEASDVRQELANLDNRLASGRKLGLNSASASTTPQCERLFAWGRKEGETVALVSALSSSQGPQRAVAVGELAHTRVALPALREAFEATRTGGQPPIAKVKRGGGADTLWRMPPCSCNRRERRRRSGGPRNPTSGNGRLSREAWRERLPLGALRHFVGHPLEEPAVARRLDP